MMETSQLQSLKYGKSKRWHNEHNERDRKKKRETEKAQRQRE